MYFMGFHPFEMLRPVSGHSVGHAVLRQLGVQLGADVPQRQEKMNDTKVDPFLGLQFTISTIGKKHATCLKQQHVCLYGACWNSTDDICIYLCTSRRNIQGKSRLLKDFEEEHLNQRNKHLIPHARACGVGYCAHGLRGIVAMQGPQGTISLNSLHEHWKIAKQNANFIAKIYTDEQ